MLRDVASLGFLALIGLSCVGGGSPLDTGADSIGETAMLTTESTTESTTMTGTSAESTSESESSADSEAGSGSGSDSESGSETDTETSSGTDTETSTETDTETETETETGMEGPSPDLGVLAILDVNPNSDTYNQNVHPLDYQGQLSGWYFGHAT